MTSQVYESAYEKKLFTIKCQTTQLIRASYSAIPEGSQIQHQVQVFAKTGTSNNYHKCLPFKAKKIKSTNKSRKIITKKKKNSSDDQYNIKSQKKDRNVTSNLIHHLIKFLLLTKGQQEQVNRIISLNKLNITYQIFFTELENVSKILKTYVTLQHIQQIWFDTQSKSREFCLIMRILSKIFLSKCGFLSIFFSNKFNTASKEVHYKGVRSLTHVLIHRDLEHLKFVS